MSPRALRDLLESVIGPHLFGRGAYGLGGFGSVAVDLLDMPLCANIAPVVAFAIGSTSVGGGNRRFTVAGL
jgi:hypothetical protein